jgi:putative PEP-CTERM system TPR-repeat lipoprotein
LLPGCDTVESLERDARASAAKGDQNAAAVHYQALLALEPGHSEASFQLGNIYATVSRLPEAETALRRAMELGKPAAEVMPALGPVLLELNKHKELLALLEPDPKRAQPSDPRVLAEYAVLRGYALLDEGDATGANTQFQLAMAALPEKAKLGMARIALSGNDRPRAEALFEEVIAANPRNTDARLARADARRLAGELDKAMAEYEEVIKAEPNNVKALLVYAIALISADQIDKAQPLLDKAKKIAPVGPLVYFAQALLDCKQKLYQSCGENLDRILAVLPQYLPALLLSGQRNHAIGNLELAQEAFLQYLRRVPADTHARKLLAITLIAKKQPIAALNVVMPMLRGNTQDPQVLGIASQARLQLGEVQEARELMVKAVKLAPDNAELRSALALTRMAGGMRRQAEADFRAAIELAPGNSKADYGLILLLLGDNRLDEARQAVAALEKRLTADPDTYMLKGTVLRRSKDMAGARLAFQQAAKIAPKLFPAVRELAEIDLAEGKPDAARRRIQDVLDADRTHLEALLTMAKLDLRTGRQAEGLSWARQAADAHPRSQDALLLASEMLADSGEVGGAMSLIQQALKTQPQNAKALKLLGRLYMDKKDYPSAVTTYTSLVAAQPASIDAAGLLAAAYLATGDYTTARAAAQDALKRNPRSLKARMLLGSILVQGKKYAEAIAFAKKLQGENPKSAFGYWLEGQTLLVQGNAKGALKPFETAAGLEKNHLTIASLYRATAIATPGKEREAPLEEWVRKYPDDDEARLYLADALGAKRRYKDAIPLYEELLRRNPRHAQALNNLAWALDATKDPRALEYAQLAFMASPNTPAVLDTYGWALVSSGKVHEGIQMLLKATSMDKNNPEMRYHLAQALIKAGDKARARAELKAILSGDLPFAHAEEARALMASLGP